MKRTLQVVALVVAIGSIAFWALAGANRGWTKTSVQKKTVDEITGIEGITWEKRFVPGVEFVGGALVGAVALAGASLLIRNKQNINQKLNNSQI